MCSRFLKIEKCCCKFPLTNGGKLCEKNSICTMNIKGNPVCKSNKEEVKSDSCDRRQMFVEKFENGYLMKDFLSKTNRNRELNFLQKII